MVNLIKDNCQLKIMYQGALDKGFTWDVAGNSVEELVRPGDCQELLPPSRGNVGDIETEDEGQGNKTEECIEVFDYAFKQPGNALIRKRADVSACHLFWSWFMSCL